MILAFHAPALWGTVTSRRRTPQFKVLPTHVHDANRTNSAQLASINIKMKFLDFIPRKIRDISYPACSVRVDALSLSSLHAASRQPRPNRESRDSGLPQQNNNIYLDTLTLPLAKTLCSLASVPNSATSIGRIHKADPALSRHSEDYGALL